MHPPWLATCVIYKKGFGGEAPEKIFNVNKPPLNKEEFSKNGYITQVANHGGGGAWVWGVFEEKNFDFHFLSDQMVLGGPKYISE